MSGRDFTARFNGLKAKGLIDLDSGAWDRNFNVRRVHCGRCGQAIRVGEGRAYNEMMSDVYRASTRYLCPFCSTWVHRAVR